MRDARFVVQLTAFAEAEQPRFVRRVFRHVISPRFFGSKT